MQGLGFNGLGVEGLGVILTEVLVISKPQGLASRSPARRLWVKSALTTAAGMLLTQSTPTVTGALSTFTYLQLVKKN